MPSPPNETPYDEFVASFTRPIGVAEDWLSFFFANLLTLGLAGLIEFMSEDAWKGTATRPRAVLTVLAAGWLIFDLTYLWRLWRNAMRGNRHPAFVTAEQQPVWPLLLRPIVGLWWLAHFAIGVLAVVGFNRVGNEHGHREPVLNFFLATCSGFAANGYLILAIATFTTSTVIRRRMWRYRVVLDITMGAIGWWFSR